MRDHVERRKWSKLKPIECEAESCFAKDYADYDHPVMYLLREVDAFNQSEGEFTREMEEAIECLLGGALTAEGWFQCFFPQRDLPSIPFLRYLFQNNRIEQNQIYPENLLFRMTSIYNQRSGYVIELEKFLIEEIGMDIHTQCAWTGASVLLRLIHTAHIHQLVPDMARVQYYLDHEADPLTEDKNGESALSFARTHMTEYPALIELLERYA